MVSIFSPLTQVSHNLNCRWLVILHKNTNYHIGKQGYSLLALCPKGHADNRCSLLKTSSKEVFRVRKEPLRAILYHRLLESSQIVPWWERLYYRADRLPRGVSAWVLPPGTHNRIIPLYTQFHSRSCCRNFCCVFRKRTDQLLVRAIDLLLKYNGTQVSVAVFQTDEVLTILPEENTCTLIGVTWREINECLHSKVPLNGLKSLRSTCIACVEILIDRGRNR